MGVGRPGRMAAGARVFGHQEIKISVVQIKKFAVAVVVSMSAFMPVMFVSAAADNLTENLTDSVAVAMADSVETVLEEVAHVTTGDSIVKRALQYLGVRYRFGHTGPNAFDCSGFTKYVYGQEDIDLTRTSRSQYGEGEAVREIRDLQKGDLVFFGGRSTPGSVGHVGIVTDVDAEENTFKFVHASRRGIIVEDFSSSSYFTRRYIGARRILQ